MIRGYRDKRSEVFARGGSVAQFRAFEDQARRRLRVLDAATTLNDLRALRSNHLETLKGKRKGQFSIRINMEWRVCFEWARGAAGPTNVEIVDYHDE
jgi:proteic killer suppression protein